MSITEMILFNIILINFPLMIYLFFLAYTKKFSVEERNLFLDIALLSSVYLAIRYQKIDSSYMSMILINVPLLIAYLKNRKLSIFILSTIIIFIYKGVFNWNPFILGIEYLIYYFITIIILKKRSRDNYLYTNLLLIIKLIIFTYFILKTNNNFTNFFKLFCWYGISLFSVAYFAIIMFNKGSEIIKLHLTLKEMEQEKQIKTSLFKITHEIKNPVAVCKGYLDMFDVNNIEHSRKYVPILKEEIERILLLLQDFLSLTKVTIEKDIIDVNLLLEDVISSYNLLLKTHNIKLNTELIDDEIYINGDYNRLVQVFINIVKNSIEAIGNNGIINIDCHIIDNQIIIEVVDNGCGISVNDIKEIRTPFFTTKKNGTGLGVSLSYEIIKAHKGEIEYKSVLGEGTNVVIKLPILAEI